MENPNIDNRGELLADFLSMCRLCLSKSNVCVDIFTDNQSVSLPLRIMACASLEVSSFDQLPKQICDDCRYQLEKSYVFRKRCRNSDVKLRRYVRRLNTSKISTPFENSEDEDEYAESQEFFNARQQEKIQHLEKKREERERVFQQRLKNFMEEERRSFHDEETKRILDEHMILSEEKRDVMHLSMSQSRRDSQSGRRSNENAASKNEILMETVVNPKMEEFYVEEEPVEAEVSNEDNPEQNEDIEFILNEEPEVEEDITLVTPEMEYEENEPEEESEEERFESEDIKEILTSPKKEPLVLNRKLKSTKAMNEDQFVFSLKPDKANQFTIKPGTSKENEEAEEQIEETESKNVIDKSGAGPTEDIDFGHLTKAVRSILAQQAGLNVDGDVKFKVLKRRDNIAEVEVRTVDGTVIVMEVELDSMLKDNNGELKIFNCTQCPRAFSRKGQLMRHASTHVKEKGLSCEYCEKWFPSKSGLDRHVRVHTGEKPFKCDICGKSFIQKEILKRHTMVHTGERPYKCEFCDKRFIQNEMLRFHINRKHTINPVVELRKCPLCTKTFSYASGLSRHLMVHTGKSFPCPYCSKTFNDRSAHKRHISTVHRRVLS